MDDPEGCAWQTHPGTYYDQPTFCEEDREPGREYCAKHQHAAAAMLALEEQWHDLTEEV